MSERTIYTGVPGTFWTNNTGKVQYQRIASLKGTCGCCLQYHLKIGASWPIPIHDGCQCIQRSVKPGRTAPYAFCDFQKILDAMDDADKEKAIGLPNYRLLASGLVAWEDIVTSMCVIQFHRVMARQKLTLAQALHAGIDRTTTEQALATIEAERKPIPKIPTLVLKLG